MEVRGLAKPPAVSAPRKLSDYEAGCRRAYHDYCRAMQREVFDSEDQFAVWESLTEWGTPLPVWQAACRRCAEENLQVCAQWIFQHLDELRGERRRPLSELLQEVAAPKSLPQRAVKLREEP